MKGGRNAMAPEGMAVLRNRKREIVQKWYQAVLASYPAETARFLREEKDPFANPVGNTIYEGLTELYEAVVGEIEGERLKACLDEIIRIRAVQEFLPSQALAFIFQLKPILEEELHAYSGKNDALKELEARLETVALLAFDVYMQCREQLWKIRVEEFKNRTARLLQRANLNISLP
ncbi:RsbRD N-terminal domain-containing protein [Neomoorella humiferrea]|uniref:RsbT co-antagonist protein RsbRD N-terminal domain-containing protein n=1 Tax=Neomoorella humiferrea TaxID=676965 RepID=A0A2T0AT76_9FIRM|nr:RsbRD N-terminal domain-containing protein [Moorella humiferrea]PRR73623.1 hypothetical protein MOHU_11580 [Moorella humiferrea]